jgi:hypothetical protein
MNVHNLHQGANEPDAVEQLLEAYYKRLPKPLRDFHDEASHILAVAKESRAGFFWITKV